MRPVRPNLAERGAATKRGLCEFLREIYAVPSCNPGSVKFVGTGRVGTFAKSFCWEQKIGDFSHNATGEEQDEEEDEDEEED